MSGREAAKAKPFGCSLAVAALTASFRPCLKPSMADGEGMAF